MKKQITQKKELQESETIIEESSELLREAEIVVYNDDVNHINYVIECFCRILGHTVEQASQCAYLIHYKGRCGVKKGTIKELQPLWEALLDNKLSALIEC
jgi:ATP-dependent Clp protease adaptor protein ClpS